VSSAVASSITNLTVLAFEPDPAKASTIHRLVAGFTRAGLTLVRSKDQLLEALRDGLPDLLLLPALLPPCDESQVFKYLRASNDKRHLEVLITPYSIVSDDNEVSEPPNGWRRMLRRTPTRQRPFGCDLDSFRERLAWSLGRARDARRDRAEHFRVFEGATVGTWSDRRVHRRFPVHALPWLQLARIEGAPKVKLLDLSSGGALVQSDIRLRRDAVGMLELVGAERQVFVPFRVIRWQPSSHTNDLRYLGACVFTTEFQFDTALGPGSTDIGLVPNTDVAVEAGRAMSATETLLRNGALAPFVRRSDEHQGRDPRRTRGDVPWLSSVNLSWGPEVDLLNISKSGMLVETTSKFVPGTSTEFRLHGQDTELSIPARVVRSEICAVSSQGVKYQAAVAFTKQVQFPGQLADDALPPQLLADLLTELLKEVRGGEGNGALRKKFLDRVRKLVRAHDVVIASSPVRPEAGAESIYFTVPGKDGLQAVLQATFEPDHALSEVEFQCLQSAATLATVVLEFERLSGFGT
jgi:hypothetical protein